MDYIFIIGPSAVGKTTLAKGLYEYYKSVYIEQNMVPEFSIPKSVKDIGLYEEKVCFDNTIMQINYFHNLGYKNIISLDFDDLRVRELPNIFKGSNYIIIRLISSDYRQIEKQMEKRHNNEGGLYDLDIIKKSNEKIKNRPLLINEVVIDIKNKNKDEILNEAINIIDNFKSIKDYDYKQLDKEYFYSWVKSNNLN